MSMDGDTGGIVNFCIEHMTSDPVKLFRSIVREKEVPMHGGIHHIIVPLVLITAYWNVKKDFDLRSYLNEAVERAQNVPETICGYWGCCGSAIGTGIFLSVITRTTPLTKGKRWGECNTITSESLSKIGSYAGPRCCKRNAVLAIKAACEYVEKEFDVKLSPSEFGCTRVADNPDCIGSKCPFYIDKE